MRGDPAARPRRAPLALAAAVVLTAGTLGCALRGAGRAPGRGDEDVSVPQGATQRAALEQASGRLALGQELELELPRLPGGERWRLSDARGAVVLLDVWATWCAPCEDALPAWQRLAERLAGRGLAIVTVSVDADVTSVEPFLRERGLALPVLADPEARYTEEVLGLRRLPTSLLVDRRGRLRRVDEGFDERTVPEVTAAVEALLAEAGDAPAASPSPRAP